MLDPSYIRDHMEEVRTGLRNRGLDPDKTLEEIATLDPGHVTGQIHGILLAGGMVANQMMTEASVGRATDVADRSQRVAESALSAHSNLRQIEIQARNIRMARTQDEVEKNAADIDLESLEKLGDLVYNGGGKEIIEYILLLAEHPRPVPFLAVLAAATQVGHGQDAADAPQLRSSTLLLPGGGVPRSNPDCQECGVRIMAAS